MESPQKIADQQLDNVNLKDYVNSKISSEKVKKLFALGAETVFGCEIDKISFYHSLFYAKQGNNFEFLISNKNGA